MIRPGRLAAGALLLALGGGVVWVAGVTRSERPLASETPGVVTGATTRSTSPTTAAPTSIVASSSTSPVMMAEPGDVAAAALDGWGVFAVTGDLAAVAPWFDANGPQWRQFADEAATIADDPAGDPTYRVWLEDPVVEVVGDGAVVRGDVVFARTGEPSQSFDDWSVVLRRRDGRWRVWTIAESGSAVPPTW